MSTHSRDWRGRPDRSLHVSVMSESARGLSLLFSAETDTLVVVRPTLEASAVGAACIESRYILDITRLCEVMRRPASGRGCKIGLLPSVHGVYRAETRVEEGYPFGFRLHGFGRG